LAGGVALESPSRYTATGVRATRALDAFTPVELGALEPQHCDAVGITLGPDVMLNRGLNYERAATSRELTR